MTFNRDFFVTNRTLISTIIVLLAVGAIALFSKNSQDTESRYESGNETPDGFLSEETPALTNPGSYSMEEVSQHAGADSCWTVIRGEVYDLTSWIERHPGGEQAIIGLCGTDGTAVFAEQHGGQGQPEQTLSSFKIGTLTN